MMSASYHVDQVHGTIAFEDGRTIRFADDTDEGGRLGWIADEGDSVAPLTVEEMVELVPTEFAFVVERTIDRINGSEQMCKSLLEASTDELRSPE
jgi:hypothetical protein